MNWFKTIQDGARFRNIRKNSTFCDAVLVAEDREFKVHKVILASQSDFFFKLFDKTSGNRFSEQYTLDGITARSLNIIINYAYTGSVNLKYEILEETLEVATHLRFDSLKEKCAEYIVKNLNQENAILYLKLVEIFNLEKKQSLKNFILKKFSILMKSKKFYLFSEQNFVEFLSNDEIKIDNELELFKLLVNWILKRNIKNPRSQENVLKLVRYGLIDALDMDTVYKNEIFFKPALIELFYSILDSHYKREEKFLIKNKFILSRSHKKSILTLTSNYIDCTTKINIVCPIKDQISLSVNCKWNFNRELIDSKYCCINNFVYILLNLYGTIVLFRPDFRNEKVICKNRISTLTVTRVSYNLVGFKNQILVIGGQDELSNPVSYISCYDLESDCWIEFCDLPQPLYDHASVALEDDLFVSGGKDSNKDPSCRLYKLQSGVDLWEQLSPMNYARASHCIQPHARFRDTHLYVIGGEASSQLIGSPEFYSTANDQWTLISAMLHPTKNSASVAFDDRIFVFGGCQSNGKNTDLIQKFYINSQKWSVSDTKLTDNNYDSIAACLFMLKIHNIFLKLFLSIFPYLFF